MLHEKASEVFSGNNRTKILLKAEWICWIFYFNSFNKASQLLWESGMIFCT